MSAQISDNVITMDKVKFEGRPLPKVKAKNTTVLSTTVKMESAMNEAIIKV